MQHVSEKLAESSKKVKRPLLDSQCTQIKSSPVPGPALSLSSYEIFGTNMQIKPLPIILVLSHFPMASNMFILHAAMCVCLGCLYNSD